jgi:hypothetical protein
MQKHPGKHEEDERRNGIHADFTNSALEPAPAERPDGKSSQAYERETDAPSDDGADGSMPGGCG